jgi:hypothetical protein
MNPYIQCPYTVSLSRAMAQAVSRRPVTVKAPVRSYVSQCEIRNGQIGTGTGF